MERVLGLARTVTSLVLLSIVASLVSPVPAIAVNGGHIITTVVDAGPIGPDGRALDPDRVMQWPAAIALATDGTMYVTDRGKYRVRKIDPDGVASTFAGVGWAKPTPDGVLAANAGLSSPRGVAVHPNGDVYISDSTNRIQKVDSAGIITTVAGTGQPGSDGDGGPALDATMYPRHLAISEDGLIYFVDGYRVRVIDQNGIVSAFAGSGTRGDTGDGGQAIDAQFMGPRAIAVDKNGALYVADLAHRVRRIDPDGIITTIAGTGEVGFDSGGLTGPATSVNLWQPTGVAVDGNLNVYITGFQSQLVRRVTPEGNISTIAGYGHSYDEEVPAAISKLERPIALATDKHNNLYIIESDGGNVRKIIQPDLDDPVVTVTSPVDGTHVDVNTAVSANFSCSDFYSGVASCTADVNGQALSDDDEFDTSTPGVKVLTVTAIDEAGNRAFTTRSITVRTPPTTTTQPTTTTTEPTTTQPTTTQPTTTTPVVTTQPSTPQPSTTQPTTTVQPSTTTTQPTTPTTTKPPVTIDPRIITGRYARSTGDTAAVARLYVAILGRQPEAAGHAYWMDQRDNGLPLRSIAAFFITSPEFRLIYGETTDAEFIDLLYQNVMNRPGDPTGQAYWIEILSSGTTRLDVTILFSQSPEFMDHTQTS